MSGSGDSEKKNDKNKLPSYMTEATTVQPFMPGWDNQIVDQLAKGGYGTAPDLRSYMNQFYSPMQLPGGAGASTGGSGTTTGGSSTGGTTGGGGSGGGSGGGFDFSGLGSLGDFLSSLTDNDAIRQILSNKRGPDPRLNNPNYHFANMGGQMGAGSGLVRR